MPRQHSNFNQIAVDKSQDLCSVYITLRYNTRKEKNKRKTNP